MTRSHRLQTPRRLWSPIVAACMSGAVLAAGASASAETVIYRYEDAEGISVFVDRPGTGRHEVDLPAVNTYTPSEAKRLAAAVTNPQSAAAEIYQALLINSPGNGETIRRNGGNVRVTGRVEPGLRADHSVVAFVDGSLATLRHAQPERERSPTEAHSDIDFALSDLARGPHTLHIAIAGPENDILIQSKPVSFHLLRAAAGLPWKYAYGD